VQTKKTKETKEDMEDKAVVLTQDETMDLYLAIVGMGGEKAMDGLLHDLKDDIEHYQAASKELLEAGGDLEATSASRALHARVNKMLQHIEKDSGEVGAGYRAAVRAVQRHCDTAKFCSHGWPLNASARTLRCCALGSPASLFLHHYHAPVP